tara:strand:- start:155191 stop:156063 length:873 start_codon:yes stop_codon:yes gene_type:complete
MSQHNNIEISNIDFEGTLESYLRELLKCSRNFLKKSSLTKKQLNLNIKPKETLFIPIEVINHGEINPIYSGEEIKLIGETDEFLILSKPANTHMHPHTYRDQNTVLNSFYQLGIGNYLKVNQAEYDRGLLYRLDYATSGLVLYAKSDEVYLKYRENFHDLVESKEYLAICKGECSDALLKDKVNYRGEKKGAGYVVEHGEYSAFIEVNHIKYLADKNLSLVKVKLYEGIRHQIRIQLSHNKNPILGDDLYQGPKADRLYLHCYRYTINGETYCDENLGVFRQLFDFDGKF